VVSAAGGRARADGKKDVCMHGGWKCGIQAQSQSHATALARTSPDPRHACASTRVPAWDSLHGTPPPPIEHPRPTHQLHGPAGEQRGAEPTKRRASGSPSRRRCPPHSGASGGRATGHPRSSCLAAGATSESTSRKLRAVASTRELSVVGQGSELYFKRFETADGWCSWERCVSARACEMANLVGSLPVHFGEEGATGGRPSGEAMDGAAGWMERRLFEGSQVHKE
jgi:hypothetical protein